ncbi:MAG: D-glycero-beta-D-manno-heptose-7-phosphate kinase [Candidatus Woesearchaeota archaeon]|nr:D-glycero-beta-D-manno-heptose-7-phosphate kinase [Candidatus Woesearchaeota archaeon]MDP6265413.1 D-glycero-beta-D-manno-heptose-7-phosphate kinase [Candidatus Woesearchaeota archaeon]MDP7322970.1 D-glycero-beta-D-manno-heptose-7-phosphate kinase [Candidatus Woesearchaeota archaeon]
MNNLLKVIEQFKNKKILILGDVMLDKYIWGDVSRISPEAPVQIVNVTRESYVPGGAANVANNIAALSAKSFIVGVVGNDNTKKELIKELEKRNVDVNGLIIDENKRTIRKVRVFGRNQQLLRFDYEKKGYVDANTENSIFDFVSKKLDEIDAIIISDYAKGTITKNLMEKLIALCKEKNKIVVIDPKPKHKGFYKNATLITPNHKEAHEMTGLAEEYLSDVDIEKMGKKLLGELNSTILITKGEKGMSLFEKDEKVTIIPTFAKEVYDIVGAGDTSAATLTLALASGASFGEAAVIANHAAGITVGKIGTSTVSIEELRKSIENA